jgi:hypothetical protein
MGETLTWWGYRHESGRVLVKRFFGPDDLIEARASIFCRAAVAAEAAHVLEIACAIWIEAAR